MLHRGFKHSPNYTPGIRLAVHKKHKGPSRAVQDVINTLIEIDRKATAQAKKALVAGHLGGKRQMARVAKASDIAVSATATAMQAYQLEKAVRTHHKADVGRKLRNAVQLVQEEEEPQRDGYL